MNLGDLVGAALHLCGPDTSILEVSLVTEVPEISSQLCRCRDLLRSLVDTI